MIESLHESWKTVVRASHLRFPDWWKIYLRWLFFLKHGKFLRWYLYPKKKTQKNQPTTERFHCCPSYRKWETGTQAVCGIFDNAWETVDLSKWQQQIPSTETALINVTYNILKAIDEKSASLLVLLDMSKAFDSLNHKSIVRKITKTGPQSFCNFLV